MLITLSCFVIYANGIIPEEFVRVVSERQRGACSSLSLLALLHSKALFSFGARVNAYKRDIKTSFAFVKHGIRHRVRT